MTANEIKHLVGTRKLKDVIDITEKYFNGPELLSIKSDHREFISNGIKGLLSFDQKNVERSKLVNRLMEYLDTVGESTDVSASESTAHLREMIADRFKSIYVYVHGKPNLVEKFKELRNQYNTLDEESISENLSTGHISKETEDKIQDVLQQIYDLQFEKSDVEKNHKYTLIELYKDVTNAYNKIHTSPNDVVKNLEDYITKMSTITKGVTKLEEQALVEQKEFGIIADQNALLSLFDQYKRILKSEIEKYDG